MHALRLLPDEPERRLAEPAIAGFIRRHQTSLWRFLRSRGCPPAEADELTQDALLIALTKAIPDDGAAAGFLRQTAKFLWLRRRRDDRRDAERLMAAAERLWQRHCGDGDGSALLDGLRACVAALPERSRRVIDRFYRDGASRTELADELQIGEHGVRTLLQRLRQALADCIERRREP